jgi:Flp pilus assembly pilin Flp
MFSKFNDFYLRLISDERGVTLVEYGIAIALAVTIGATALLPILANDVGNAMSNAGAKMP